MNKGGLPECTQKCLRTCHGVWLKYSSYEAFCKDEGILEPEADMWSWGSVRTCLYDRTEVMLGDALDKAGARTDDYASVPSMNAFQPPAFTASKTLCLP